MAQYPKIANRYRIEREIGRGGTGVVYAVKHLHTGESLAMKVLLSHTARLPDVVQRFRREMKASAMVRSEHVVRITDADIAPELEGAPFLIMELLSGADLGRLLTECGARPKEEVLWILGQAARGLERAHVAGIVHRDLKPENLFLHRSDEGRLLVKLLDFGIARMDDQTAMPATEARVTRDGAILGTPLYLTPEQALGEAEKIGPATDMWPLGLIAYEFLTGASYWAEEQMTTMLAKIIFKPLVPPSAKGVALGPRFDEWFLRSCARDPAQRWPSVTVQVEALCEALACDRTLLSSAEVPPGLREWLASRPAPLPGAGAPSTQLSGDTAPDAPTLPADVGSRAAGAAGRDTPLVSSTAAAAAPVARGGKPVRGLAAAVVVGVLCLMLALFALRGRERPPTSPPPIATAPASVPTPAGTAPPATPRVEPPAPARSAPPRPGAHTAKAGHPRPQPKKPRDPADYDPSAP